MTPNLEALRELLVKARAATEGSRELDAAVAVAFMEEGDHHPEADGRVTTYLNPGKQITQSPTYTTRDYDPTAVVGLMKEGWDWRVQMVGVLAMAAIIVPGNYVSDYDTAPTPALALLIAVIEAWIYELENEND